MLFLKDGSNVDFLPNVVILESPEGGDPPCAAPNGMVWDWFGLKTAINFDHYGFKSAIWLSRGPQKRIEAFVFSTPSE